MPLPSELHDIVRKVLADDPNFYVPVKKLYKLHLRGRDLPSYEDFLSALRSDPDLVVDDFQAAQSDLDDQDRAEMEALGFFDGPRARLKSRVPSLQDITGILQRHTQNMMDSLGKAYALAVDADCINGDEEDQLLALLQHSNDLRDEIGKLSQKIGDIEDKPAEDDGGPAGDTDPKETPAS